jgi:hypothetical protein
LDTASVQLGPWSGYHVLTQNRRNREQWGRTALAFLTIQ